jgi:hypothetical protein
MHTRTTVTPVCQPLIDYLIHDFFECKDANPPREPCRLVLTGCAFDAVLATVIASELISAFISYREDHQTHTQHTAKEWNDLFNHIRSSIFVLSFMLPSVFSKQHLSPHQIRKTSFSGSKVALHEVLGLNMLNVTFFNCICSKLVELWLSIDRDYVADNVPLWKEASQLDVQVLTLLQKLTSRTVKVDQFESSIKDSFAKVQANVKKLQREQTAIQREQTAKRKTFVADYKAKGSVALPGRLTESLQPLKPPSLRFLDSERTKDKTVLEKGRDLLQINVLHNHNFKDDAWPGMLTFVQKPFNLLKCNIKFLRGSSQDASVDAHRKMDLIASWFLPISIVYEIASRDSSEPPVGRKKTSYGAPRGLTKPPLSISSRMSVKPLRSSIDSKKGPDRLLVQFCSDSTDSHALTRNCFAVSQLWFFFVFYVSDGAFR